MSDPRSAPCDPTGFFGFSVPRPLATLVFGSRRISLGVKAVVLATSPTWSPEGGVEPSGRSALVSYPDSVDALFHLLLDGREDCSERDRVEVLIPRSILHDLADRAGADLVTQLKLCVGAAAADPIMKALQECFTGLRALGTLHGAALAKRMVDALNTHLAERYGGMRKPVGLAGGGLAPWQLRLARRSLNNLEASTPLSDIARDCGLSSGHFARAFKRSTGKSPHQWNVQRRIEAAKEMLGIGLPLAEIAVACRFSDQSHLTRAFSQATGLTPGRWRMGQAMAHAL